MGCISKQLSRVLRRDAGKEGLRYDPAGWVDLGEVRAYLAGALHARIHMDMICSVARSSDKGRFQLLARGSKPVKIRSPQGSAPGLTPFIDELAFGPPPPPDEVRGVDVPAPLTHVKGLP